MGPRPPEVDDQSDLTHSRSFEWSNIRRWRRIKIEKEKLENWNNFPEDSVCNRCGLLRPLNLMDNGFSLIQMLQRKAPKDTGRHRKGFNIQMIHRSISNAIVVASLGPPKRNARVHLPFRSFMKFAPICDLDLKYEKWTLLKISPTTILFIQSITINVWSSQFSRYK